MKNIMFLMIGFFACAPSATADEKKMVPPIVNTTPSSTQFEQPRGFMTYFSFGAGYGDSAGSKNDKAEGAPSSLKFLGSYTTSYGRGVFDFGYGVQNHNFVHSLAMDKSISAGVAEVAARYQFKNQWQFGIVYDHTFNVGKNFYADQADVIFAGGQLLRQFTIADGYQGRLGGRLVNGINIKNEVFNMAMIDIQLSFPAF